MNQVTSTITLILLLLTFVNQGYSQDNSSISLTSKLSLKGYIEAYYGYDFSPPENNRRPDFLNNHTQHNKFSVNTGILGLNYEGTFLRSNLSFILGSYQKQNLANEPKFLNHVYEMNVGFKLLKNHELWLDFGIMESNMGFESIRGIESYTLSRSLMAESSPYYLNAAKLSFITVNKKWDFEVLFSNGWNQMVDGYPSFGHTVKYKPNENLLINSSSFIGRVQLPGIVPMLTRREFRILHDLYAKYEKGKIGIIGGVDFGFDQLVENTADNGSWVGATGIFQYRFHPNWAASFRAEYFLDPSNSVASMQDVKGFENIGASLNIDYHWGKIAMVRIEGRLLSGKEEHYLIDSAPSRNNIYAGASLILSLWR